MLEPLLPVIDVRRLLWACFVSCWTLHCKSIGILCSRGLPKVLFVSARTRNSRCPHYLYLLFSWAHSVGLSDSLTKHKLKNKIIKNLKMLMADHETKHGAPLSVGPCVPEQVPCPWGWPYPHGLGELLLMNEYLPQGGHTWLRMDWPNGNLPGREREGYQAGEGIVDGELWSNWHGSRVLFQGGKGDDEAE